MWIPSRENRGKDGRFKCFKEECMRGCNYHFQSGKYHYCGGAKEFRILVKPKEPIKRCDLLGRANQVKEELRSIHYLRTFSENCKKGCV